MKAPLCLTLTAVSVLCACYDPVYDRPTSLDTATLSPVQDPDYVDDIEPIWARSCGPGCHTSDNPSGGLSLDGGGEAIVRIDATQANFMALVEPEDPDRSYLWLKLEDRQTEAGGSGSQMPQAKTLSSADRQTLLNWIEGGAPH